MTDTYLVEQVLGLLKRVKPSGTGYVALCPAHDDHNPSLRITSGNDGRVLLKCFAGCTFTEICKAIGLDENDMFARTASVERKRREPTKRHFATLADATGRATAHGCIHTAEAASSWRRPRRFLRTRVHSCGLPIFFS